MKKTSAPAAAGPRVWSEPEKAAIKQAILGLAFEEGMSLNKAMKELRKEREMPCRQTIYTWKEEDPAFAKALADARQDTADMFNDEAMALVHEMSDKIRHGISFNDQEVAGYKVAIEEYRREAGLRDDRNYSNRKKVDMNVTGAVDGAGMADVYAKMREAAAKKDE